jgi:hypothetical protein
LALQVAPISPVKADEKSDDYRHAFKWAVTEYEKQQQLKKNKQKFIGAEKVAKLAKEKFNGVGPSRRKIEAAAADGQYSPGKRGKPEHMPRAVGDFLHETTTLLRCHSIPVYASVIIEQAKYLIAGTKWEDLFAFDMSRDDDSVLKWDEEKLRRWYRERFLTRPGISTAAQRGLDSQRLKWCTSENFEQAYQNWEDVHVEAGIAYYNTDWDPQDPKSERIKFVESELYRSASFDEVALEADTGSGRKNKSEKTVIDRSNGRDDDGECVSSRGSARMSGIGCSYLDNQPGVAVMLLKGETADAKLLGEGFTMNVAGENKKGWVLYTPGGGMTNDCISDVMEKAITWRWQGVESPWEQKNRKRLRIITTDGVGIHINPKFLQYLLDNDIRLVLRCPYSSSKTQPEDVTSFWYLKNNAQTGFYKAKQAKLASMIVSNPNATLTESDIIECTGPAWRQTFTPEKIGIGYASCGYRPNTRRPVWDLLKKERQAEKALSRASRKPNKSKPEELNFEAAIGKMATLLGVDEKAKKKAEETDDQKRARLTSGDIALIPGGANGSKAMPFAQLKAAVGEIKLMNGGPCDDTLKSIGLSTDGKVPTRRARLLLCSAMYYNLGRLPRVWVDAETHTEMRNALKLEAPKFEMGGFIERLPEAKRENAKRVLNYWIEQVAVDATTQPSQSSEDSAPTKSSAVSSLANMFSTVPAPAASQDDVASQGGTDVMPAAV